MKCYECKKNKPYNGDWYNGMCPECADATEPPEKEFDPIGAIKLPKPLPKKRSEWSPEEYALSFGGGTKVAKAGSKPRKGCVRFSLIVGKKKVCHLDIPDKHWKKLQLV